MVKRGVVAAVALAVLSACGGGGGDQVGGSTAIPTAPGVAVGGVAAGTPAPASTAAPIQTADGQRATASRALATFSGVQQAVGSNGAGIPVLGTLRQPLRASADRVTAAYRSGARRTAGAPRATSGVSYGACANGVETATVAVSPTEHQIYERAFYDGACTKLEADIFVDTTATSSSSAAANGTVALYDIGGNATSYETLAMTLTGLDTGTPDISVIANQGPSPSAPPLSSQGLACTMGAASLACGLGGVTHETAVAQDVGATMSLSAVPAVTSNRRTVTVSGSVTGYIGALGALTLSAGPFPTFVITGGTVTGGGSYSGSYVFTTTGAPSGATLSLAYPTSDAAAAIAATGSPVTYTGTVKRVSTNAVVATFTVDAAGNGTITYSNGTTGQIVNWQILG